MKVVKFAPAQNSKVSPLTEPEISSVQMNATYKMVRAEKDKLEAEREQLDKEIRSLVRSNQKMKALPLLRKKKRVEKNIEEKEGVLLNMEVLQDKLAQCKTDRKVVESLRVGNDAMKQMRKEMGIDDVEKVMDDVAETIDQSNDITDLMNNMSMTSQPEEDELEAELQELLNEDVVLPTLPAALPTTTDVTEPKQVPAKKPTEVKKSRPSMQ